MRMEGNINMHFWQGFGRLFKDEPVELRVSCASYSLARGKLNFILFNALLVCIFLACFLCCIICTCVCYFSPSMYFAELCDYVVVWLQAGYASELQPTLLGFMIYTVWGVFLFCFFPLVFSSKRFFYERFFPWACYMS